MVGWFAEVCRKRGLRVNEGKSKVMVLNRVHVSGICLEHISEFKYLEYVLDKSSTDGAECSRKVASGRMVAGAIRSLDNARDLQPEYTRVLHDRSE